MTALATWLSEYVADNGNVCGREFVSGNYARRYVRLRDGSRVFEDTPPRALGVGVSDAHLLGDGLSEDIPDEVA